MEFTVCPLSLSLSLSLSLLRSLWIKVCYVSQYAENKLSVIKTRKPFCYLFPLTPVDNSSGPTSQNENEPPVIKGDLRSKKYKSRSPSPDEMYENTYTCIYVHCTCTYIHVHVHKCICTCTCTYVHTLYIMVLDSAIMN